MREIPYYSDYISSDLYEYLSHEAKNYAGIDGLTHIGESGGLETKDSLRFLCKLYDEVKENLNIVLNTRIQDRAFIDQRVKTYYQFNQEQGIDFLDKKYRTILGDEDSYGRIVVGPKLKNYCGKSKAKKVAPIPDFLKGFHVTLFGPPDDPKLSINAMNAYHRKLKGEPAIIEEILALSSEIPMWGADDEDSKTPLRQDLINASKNLSECFDGSIEFQDQKRNKIYGLESQKLAQPIKRFPGLALPSSFLFYRGNPLPLHLYDFALHLFAHWHNPKALTFYVPKLENEEEAAYIKLMIETAERMIKNEHPEYEMGTVRVVIVLENPRAVFRVNEIMDELYPYFVGASLGWHDYLGSTARLLKEDGNYRIPVKADPDIVIKYIKASHELLANVVGERGGIKIGGMYGILPIDNDLCSESFQITIRGFFRDVITQMKRNLSGYWVAHPDFIRIGMAIVEAWKIYQKGDEAKLKNIIHALLNETYAKEIWEFVSAKDIESLDIDDELYARSLIVADIKESSFIANNDPEEIRYNVFQMLQYLTDWLGGNGCVALPTHINGIAARVMDDLATAERSRWEVWHEIYHGRFSIEEFIEIAHEEMNFIRRDLSDHKKIVQIKYSEGNAKWYEVAFKLMLQLMANRDPVEFATELLLPFTIDSIRSAEKPWDKLSTIDPHKYKIDSYNERYNYYFEICGAHRFAQDNVINFTPDRTSIEASIYSFEKEDILSAAAFHGDIGQNQKGLDAMAKREQSQVTHNEDLLDLTQKYREKFGMKFLISAKDKTSEEILGQLRVRLNNTPQEELENAKQALLEITQKRVNAHPYNRLGENLQKIFDESKVRGVQIGISSGKNCIQNLAFGKRNENDLVTARTQFQIASLSKTFASAVAIELFKNRRISLSSKVNHVLSEYGSDFKLQGEWGDDVELQHLMNHSALNMHYVNGVPCQDEMPDISTFLKGNAKYNYEAIKVINRPGEQFHYSGAGFILLEYIVNLVTKKKNDEICVYEFSPKPSSDNYANSYFDDGTLVANGYKMFPCFAAGMWGTAEQVLTFLQDFTYAYHHLDGSLYISHDTAVQMAYAKDKGCKKFMNALMGLGVFTIEAGDNSFLLHQGANDGQRAIFLYCYKGPDIHKGVTILCNGEYNGVLLNAKLLQEILIELKIEGIDFEKFKTSFSNENLKQEEVVNIGYKNLVFDAFLPTLPEEIAGKKILNDLHAYNLVLGAAIVEVSNQRFARAENLISPYVPLFDPTAFGKQGKIMDSWETARHNEAGYDYVKIVLKQSSDINFISLSTQFHDGNQVEWVEIFADQNLILPKIQLKGHSLLNFKLEKTARDAKEIEVRAYPDGGLTRLGLYKNLPESIASQFQGVSQRYPLDIPRTLKPLGIAPLSYRAKIKEECLNWASSALGARVISASDEHYAPAINVLSPFAPLNMFDGFESKRSRGIGHREELEVEFARRIMVSFLVFDFTYFVNNNPRRLSVTYLDQNEWKELVSIIDCKAYAGNFFKIVLEKAVECQRMKFYFYPDGGVNRIKVFGK